MSWTDVNGHALYYEEDGAGDALVLLHGDYECAHYWSAQREAFARTRRVVVYDRHGFGRSAPRVSLPPTFYDEDAADLVALLDHLRVARAHLVGHSGGGTVALLAAARHPERVRSVVTSGAHIYVEDLTLAYIHAFAVGLEAGTLRRAGEACHGQRWRAVADMFVGRWLDPGWRDWTILPVLSRIICPVLLIQGSEDGSATLEQFDVMSRSISAARQWLVAGGGHVIHRRMAGEFNEQVLRFLATVP